MTEQELAAIEALANAATPGPWFDDAGYRIHGPTEAEDKRAGEVLHHYKQMCYGDDGCQQYHDAVYIAAMHPQQTLALIAEVRRLRPLVEAAYVEAFDDGVRLLGYEKGAAHWGLATHWSESEARKELGGL